MLRGGEIMRYFFFFSMGDFVKTKLQFGNDDENKSYLKSNFKISLIFFRINLKKKV